MIDAALGALILLLLAGFRNHPLVRFARGRAASVVLGSVAAIGAILATLHGEWLGGALLLAAAVWLAAGVRGAKTPAPALSPMALDDARAMLGVPTGAGRDEIEAAYRRLMQRVHPDKGGAPGLAAQLNVAREALLRSVVG